MHEHNDLGGLGVLDGPVQTREASERQCNEAKHGVSSPLVNAGLEIG